MNKEELKKQIELLVKDDEKSQETIIKQSQEIERLNNIINDFEEELEREVNTKEEEIHKKEAMYDNLAVDYRLAQEEIERLNNIIKEVREYITSHREAVDERGEHIIYFLTDDFDEKDILQILDKGE